MHLSLRGMFTIWNNTKKTNFFNIHLYIFYSNIPRYKIPNNYWLRCLSWPVVKNPHQSCVFFKVNTNSLSYCFIQHNIDQLHCCIKQYDLALNFHLWVRAEAKNVQTTCKYMHLSTFFQLTLSPLLISPWSNVLLPSLSNAENRSISLKPISLPNSIRTMIGFSSISCFSSSSSPLWSWPLTWRWSTAQGTMWVKR